MTDTFSMKTFNFIRIFLFSCCALASVHVIGAAWAGFGEGWFGATLLVTFTACGLFLFWFAAGEIRAQALGTAFLLVASDFSHSITANLDISFAALRFLFALPVEIFLGYTTWYLVGQFPRISGPRRGLEFTRLVILVASCVLFFYNVLAMAGLIDDSLGISVMGSKNLTDLFVYGLTLFSLPLCWWANRVASPHEKKKVKLFLAGLTLGLGIPSIDIVLTVAFPVYSQWITARISDQFLTPALQLCVLTIPITTSYAMVVDEVMDLRIAFAKAARYLLGKWLISAITAIPFALLLQYLYDMRAQSLASIATDPAIIVLVALVVVGIWAIRSRSKLLDSLEKKFYRSTAATATLLNDLITSIPTASNTDALCRTTISRLEAALFPEYIRFYVLDPGFNRYRDVADHELYLEPDSETIAAALLQQQATRHPGPNGEEVLLPLYSLEGWLLGLIFIGPKKSELAYNDREIALLSTVGTTVALGLESQDMRNSRQHQTQQNGQSNWRGLQTENPNWLVRVCQVCSNTWLPERTECCNQATGIGPLPRVVNGRFNLETRLGAGITAEVYRATDLGLNRQVALKVLHNTEASIEELQKESRTCAALQHPSLASIFDIQWCAGKPVLVFELLEGGTLEKRLASGPLTVAEVIKLGLQMSDALAYIHRYGIWHHDIKPSNIAFTADGKPKMLDFGLARMTRRKPNKPTIEVSEMEFSVVESRHSVSVNGLVGTPLYWSPEIIQGKASSPSVDVWALCLMLYETLTGTNPVQSPNWFESTTRIVKGNFPSATEHRKDCPSALADILSRGLHPEFARRLNSAEDLNSALAAVSL